jgi:hypothetical protein
MSWKEHKDRLIELLQNPHATSDQISSAWLDFYDAYYEYVDMNENINSLYDVKTKAWNMIPNVLCPRLGKALDKKPLTKEV